MNRLSLNNYIVFFFILFYSGPSNCLNLCGDWTQYKEIKCLLPLEKVGTEGEAVKSCIELDKSSTLITIHSKEEQEFLNKLLSKYNKTANNVWIGLRYKEGPFLEGSYNWTDGTNTSFENWDKDAVKNGHNPCAQMSILDNSLGKWRDESCKGKALFVCQKKPELTFSLLKDIMGKMDQELKIVIEKSNKELKYTIEKQNQHFTKQVDSMIPLGFLYTQLPHQSPPQELWPNMKWSDVTGQYSGLFFRAAGSGAERFGHVQNDNTRDISNVKSKGCTSSHKDCGWNQVHLTSGWSRDFVPKNAMTEINFYKNGGEIRPRNTAVLIWRREK